MVSPKLQERIKAAVRELAYVPDIAASRLASARTHTIGVIVSSLTNGVFADYINALHDTLLPAGFQVLILSTRYSAEEEEKAIATMLGQHPEAIIIVGIDQSPHARRLLQESGVPVVQTFQLTDDPIDVNIGLDQRAAAKAATNLLIASGHRRIGAIGSRLDARARVRVEGYRAAMQQAGLLDEGLIATTPTQTNVMAGRELIGRLIDEGKKPDAVFCCDDLMALGALFECLKREIKVPKAMSIIGFNDLEFAAAATPPLATVVTPRYEMGERAAKTVMRMIETGERPAERRIDLGFTLERRGSIADRR
ncbi:LacI family transcriptional regulator [Dongia mobilis]|uniref:LacI family transcriptional regulator n=2 Tax=Dongia mobilis TaxID=578943 RepID=A0A4R6WZ08_9PROT|nr:LacI family transcriptional regulator [Dongia mobilis]